MTLEQTISGLESSNRHHGYKESALVQLTVQSFVPRYQINTISTQAVRPSPKHVRSSERCCKEISNHQHLHGMLTFNRLSNFLPAHEAMI